MHKKLNKRRAQRMLVKDTPTVFKRLFDMHQMGAAEECEKWRESVLKRIKAAYPGYQVAAQSWASREYGEFLFEIRVIGR